VYSDNRGIATSGEGGLDGARQHQTEKNVTRIRTRTKAKPQKGSPIGDDLVEAFQEMAAYLRGEIQAEGYNPPNWGAMKQARIKAIRGKHA